jgi:hypothetical protein
MEWENILSMLLLLILNIIIIRLYKKGYISKETVDLLGV